MGDRNKKPSNILWRLNEETLLEMLTRCHGGESPDDVYMQMYMDLFTEEDD